MIHKVLCHTAMGNMFLFLFYLFFCYCFAHICTRMKISGYLLYLCVPQNLKTEHQRIDFASRYHQLCVAAPAKTVAIGVKKKYQKIKNILYYWKWRWHTWFSLIFFCIVFHIFFHSFVNIVIITFFPGGFYFHL